MPTSHNPYAPPAKATEAKLTVEAEKDAPVAIEEDAAATEAVQGVPEGSAAEVLEWVGEDKTRAKEALEAEDKGNQRIGLTRKLKELAE